MTAAYTNAGFRLLRVQAEGGVARVVVDHPPLNLQDEALVDELDRLAILIEDDPEVRVVIVQSAVGDFFMAHLDVTAIRSRPPGVPPEKTSLGRFQRMIQRWAELKPATIAQLEGRARGGGSEFALALDMRFAALGRAWLAQPEIALEALPGGGGGQRLVRLMGRGRALEALLGGDDFDAETAAAYGYVNRACAADALGPFIDTLAARIASFPRHSIAEIKRCAALAEFDPRPGLAAEGESFARAAATDATQGRIAAFLAAGGQTPAAESHRLG